MTESSSSTQSLGSLWEIKSKDNVAVTKPDGSVQTFASFSGVVGVVLDSAGEWSAEVDGKPVTIKAG